ncbi:MAG: DUF3293 domain-containing protein [Pseudomonadales bacterium]
MTTADAALDRAYRRAHYRLHLRTGALDLEVDRREPALAALLAGYGVAGAALISACNPGSRPTSTEANVAAQARLLARVSAAGYPWHDAEALDPDGAWPAEPGLLILGIDRTQALALARDFCQNALLYVDGSAAPRLIWTRPPAL